MKYAIRSMFVPSRKGNVFIQCDLSQAESWVVAYLANEVNMKQSLMHSDIHTDTACYLFAKAKEHVTKDERYLCKRLNHASSYRMSAERFTQVVNKDAPITGVSISLREARKYSKGWHDLYHLRGWWAEIDRELSSGRKLVNLYGRPRTFHGFFGDELKKSATAAIPQGTVADHANGYRQLFSNADGTTSFGPSGGIMGIKRIKDQYGITFRHTAHDSIMVECALDKVSAAAKMMMAQMRRPIQMIDGTEFIIPVDCEVGDRWGEMEKL